MNIIFKSDDLVALSARARREMPQALERRRKQIITGILALVKSGFTKEAPVFRGILHNSFGARHDGMYGEVFSAGAAGIYAEVVNEGRRPGTWPNIGAIRRYVDLKMRRGGITVNWKVLFPGRKKKPSREQIVNTLAFLKARAIKEKGTRANPYIERGLALMQGKITDFTNKITELLRRDLEGA